MKIAICFYGQPRRYKEVLDDWKRVIKETNADVFMHTWSGKDRIGNNIDINENPPNVEGAEPGESADDLMGRYMAHMIPALLIRACHPVLIGSAVYPSMDVVGIEGAENWDQAALFRYKSRRAFLDIVTNPAFKGEHHFKTAALEKTIAFPIETNWYLSDPRLLLGLMLLALTALVDGWRLSRLSKQSANQE